MISKFVQIVAWTYMTASTIYFYNKHIKRMKEIDQEQKDFLAGYSNKNE